MTIFSILKINDPKILVTPYICENAMHFVLQRILCLVFVKSEIFDVSRSAVDLIIRERVSQSNDLS